MNVISGRMVRKNKWICKIKKKKQKNEKEKKKERKKTNNNKNNKCVELKGPSP